MGTSSGAYELNHECTTTSTHTLVRDKTRLHMFYFDSNTTVPVQCAALVFLESVSWQDDCSLGTQYNFISDAYNINSITTSRSMNAFRYFNDARFNFYTNDFAMHNFY